MSARLSKDGAHVLCAMVDCGQALGWIMQADDENNGKPFVWLPPGWAWRKSDRVWRLTARARERLRAGRSPQALVAFANKGAEFPIGWLPALPWDIVCPACDLRQTLDADALGLLPTRWRVVSDSRQPPFYGIRQLCPGPEFERWQREPLRLQ